MVKHLEWFGCYKRGWGGVLTPAAFQHPAKVSLGLAERIYDYLLENKMVKEGDTVLDPFGGIAGFAYSAMYRGLHFIGCELEPKFVDLGNQNIALWNSRYAGKLPRWGSARLLQGDSRRLREVVAAAGCAVSSPPYSGSRIAGGEEFSTVPIGSQRGKKIDSVKEVGYSTNVANLGNLKGDGFDAAISSPPYEEARIGQESGQEHCPRNRAYGDTPGQLGNMPSFRNETDKPKEIQLTQGKVALVSEIDFERASKFTWYATKRINGWYAARSERVKGTKNKKVIYLHRFIAGVTDSVKVDHINLDGLDCRRENLRIATMSQNLANRPKTSGNTSGYKGVYWREDRGVWKASIEVQGRQIHFGHFESQEDAARVYDEAATKYFGEFAYLNFGHNDAYGGTPGQMGAMKSGGYDAAVSSPPYEGSPLTYEKNGLLEDGKRPYKRDYMDGNSENYGGNKENIANADDFWSAARQVVAETYAVLAPGAVAVWVVKDFIRNKARVPFCDQWRQLCEACGFTTYAIARAWLVEDHGTQLGMDGNHKRYVTKKMSFFRRLHEKKYPETAIDWEDVLIMRKP